MEIVETRGYWCKTQVTQNPCDLSEEFLIEISNVLSLYILLL